MLYVGRVGFGNNGHTLTLITVKSTSCCCVYIFSLECYQFSGIFFPQNFLDNFPSSDVWVFVARTFLLFQMTTVYPLLGYLVRVQVMSQIFGSHYPG